MDLGDAFAGLAIIVSLGAAWFAWHQQNASFRLAWYEQVVVWARECVRALSGAHELAGAGPDNSPSANERKRKLLESLTSLADEGRFIFENDRSSDYGKSKPYAYRGIRPDLINNIVDSYDILKSLDLTNHERCTFAEKQIINFKRDFVSDVVKVIEPNWFSRKAKITPKPIK